MPKLRIDRLMLEVTQWCDLECAHCLRGPRRRAKMSKQIVYELAKNEIEIGCLSFTGGEPRFGTEIIREAAWSLYYNDVWLKTNGAMYSKKLADAYMLAYDKSDSPDISLFEISGDQYHPSNKSVFYSYQEYFSCKGYDEDLVVYDKYPINSLIADGRAEETGSREPDQYTIDDIELHVYGDTITVEEPVVYITANGDIVLGCDHSFKRAKKSKLGNILTHTLYEALSIDMHLEVMGHQSAAQSA